MHCTTCHQTADDALLDVCRSARDIAFDGTHVPSFDIEARAKLVDLYWVLDVIVDELEMDTEPHVYDELNSSHQIVHAASTQALAVGFAMVNASPTFFSPDRWDPFGALMVNQHDQPSDVMKSISTVARLPHRAGAAGVGYDGLGIAVVELANDGSPVLLVTGPPAPPPGDPLNYDAMIRRVAHEYDTRFGGL